MCQVIESLYCQLERLFYLAGMVAQLCSTGTMEMVLALGVRCSVQDDLVAQLCSTGSMEVVLALGVPVLCRMT